MIFLGKFKVQGNENDIKAKTINMIAGGTGIAPMLQVARDILKSSDDQVRHLVTRFRFILHLPFTLPIEKYSKILTRILDKYKLDIC